MIRPHCATPEVACPKATQSAAPRRRRRRVDRRRLDAEPWWNCRRAFTNEFAHDLSSVPERCFFVVDCGRAGRHRQCLIQKRPPRSRLRTHSLGSRRPSIRQGFGKAVGLRFREAVPLARTRSARHPVAPPGCCALSDFGFLPTYKIPTSLKTGACCHASPSVLDNMEF